MLGEITPEGLRILQERDRGFADLFHIIPVREPTDADTLRILIDQQRRLEGKHAVAFGLDVLPAVIDLQRRHDRSAAFPGKAAAVLTRLAVRATATDAEALLHAVFGKARPEAESDFPLRPHVSPRGSPRRLCGPQRPGARLPRPKTAARPRRRSRQAARNT